MKNIALLFLRLTVGVMLAAHGAQKLFGWFGGRGLKATHGFMESLGMRPGRIWGTMAAVGEFSGGVLTALGFLNPLGPLNIMAAMIVAVRRAHWKLPIFANQGGGELALTNLVAAFALAVLGPGRISVDGLLGIRMPRPLRVLAALTTIATTYAALQRPEVAEKVVSTVTGAMKPTQEPGLEVETRPRQGAPIEQPVH